MTHITHAPANFFSEKKAPSLTPLTLVQSITNHDGDYLNIWKRVLFPGRARSVKEALFNAAFATTLLGLVNYFFLQQDRTAWLTSGSMFFYMGLMFVGMLFIHLPKTHYAVEALSSTVVCTVAFLCLMTALSHESLTFNRILLFIAVIFPSMCFVHALRQKKRRGNSP